MREKKLVSLFALNPGDLCLPLQGRMAAALRQTQALSAEAT